MDYLMQTPGQIYLARRLRERTEQYTGEIAEIESRKGELPKRDLTELRQLREQIEQAVTERATAKETLVATRTTEQAKRAELQTQLDAAQGKVAKDAVRLQIDECAAKLEQARLDLDTADQELEKLRQKLEDNRYETRLAKGELPSEAQIKERKDKDKLTDADKAYLARVERQELDADELRQHLELKQQEKELLGRKAWLAKRGK
jgi:hypothetical protein